MVAFDEGVAAGNMNIELATKLLQAQKDTITLSACISVREGMGDTAAGMKVLKWLKASGLANDLSFLLNTRFAAILIDFLSAERAHEVVWDWIDTSIAMVKNASEATLPKAPNFIAPLLLLIQADCKENPSIEVGYNHMLRAAHQLRGSENRRSRLILGPPGRYLIHHSTILRASGSTPSPKAFDQFVDLMPMISYYAGIYTPQLLLHHPTHPQVTPALTILRNNKYLDRVLDSRPRRPETQVINLCLDTAKYLLDHERLYEAQEVMEVARTKFPHQIEYKTETLREKAKAEVQSIELLEELELAL